MCVRLGVSGAWALPEMPFVEGAEPYVSAAEVDKDGPAVQQLVPHIARGEVLHGVVGSDQEAVALSDAFCIDGKGWFVIALAAFQERNREAQGFRSLQHVYPIGVTDPERPYGRLLLFGTSQAPM